ncbi:MAG TPA: tetratricopeptide repeat protein, partial [Terracidiphilus sp.]
ASFRIDNHSTLANAAWPWPPGISIPTVPVPPDSPAAFHLLAAAYHPPHLLPAFQSSAASPQLPNQADDTFLAQQAKELGFSSSEINAAITKFSKTVDDPWQKGLAAIYEGRYPEAADLIRKSIDAAPSEIDRYTSLSYAEYMQGHYAAAETALRKVLAVHPDDPMLLTNLGTILTVEGKNGEAETDLKRAISLNETRADLTATAQSRSTLAFLYFQEGKYSLSEEQMQKALELDKKADDPVAYGTDYLYLAGLFTLQGRFAESGTMARNALNAHQTVFGGESPALVMDLFLLSLAALQQGKLSEAEESDQHALKILRDSGQAGSMAEANLLAGLGNVYNTQHRSKEALTQFNGALQIVDKLQKALDDPLGPDARFLRSARGYILSGIGNTYYLVDYNAPAAEPAYEQALSLLDASSPSDTFLVATVSQTLADIYVSEGKSAQAEPLYRNALQIFTQRAPDSLQIALVMTGLASVEYESPPKTKEAEELLSRSIEIKEKLFGKNSPALGREQRILARVYCSAGKCQQAEPIIRQELADDVAKLGENSAMAPLDLGDLGYFYPLRRS